MRACGKTAGIRQRKGEQVTSYLLVFFGGGLGASLRHLVNLICARCIGIGFPWGTFIINITGSTVMGLIAGYLAFKGEASQPWRLFIMTGILGGYTTFSAFSLDAALLYERGELARANQIDEMAQHGAEAATEKHQSIVHRAVSASGRDRPAGRV